MNYEGRSNAAKPQYGSFEGGSTFSITTSFLPTGKIRPNSTFLHQTSYSSPTGEILQNSNIEHQPSLPRRQAKYFKIQNSNIKHQ